MVLIQKKIKEVRIKRPTPPEWQPGVNTLVYMPLNGDMLDYSGNNNNGTASSTGTVSFNTLGNIKYAYFDRGAIELTSMPFTGNQTFTHSAWMKLNSSGYSIMHRIGTNQSYQRSELWVGNYSTTKPSLDWVGGTLTMGTYIPTEWNGTWKHCVFVHEGSSNKIYINGELYGEGSLELNITSGDKMIGGTTTSARSGFGISESILENRAWTLKDASDYYNSTKSRYGGGSGEEMIKIRPKGYDENSILAAINNSNTSALDEITQNGELLSILVGSTACTTAFIAKNTLLQSYVSKMWNTVTTDTAHFSLVGNSYGDDSWNNLVTNAATANSITFFSGGYYSSSSNYGWMKHRDGTVAIIGKKGGAKPQSVTTSNVEGVSFVGATFGQCGSATSTTTTGDGYVAAATYKLK